MITEFGDKVIIAVVGPFRGGTSCVAGCLHNLGINMGERLMEAKDINAKGTFECLDFHDLMRQVHDYKNNVRKVDFSYCVAVFRSYLHLRRGETIGVKHPLLCLYVKEIVAAWPNVKIVSVNRNKQAILQSASKISWLKNYEPLLDRMLQARNAALKEVDVPVLTIQYEDLLKHPEENIRRLCNFCDILCSQQQFRKALEFVDPRLNHFVKGN